MKHLLCPFLTIIVLVTATSSWSADTVPSEIMQPGTQPNEVGNLESPDKCDNCHGGYDRNAEPAFQWRGSAMGNAGRDPIFWATLAIAEQDFGGAGDLCIRCHSTGGWYGGRSTPTDGSGLAASDADGVDCDTCHKMTNTDNSEHFGEMLPPFIANVDDNILQSPEGYYGSGMLSLWGGSDKLGPYAADDAQARHQRMRSRLHRDVNFCGSCHDVSNPVVGDLAPNNGTQASADGVISSGGNLGGSVEQKAAFNNPPYMYGIVERTFSEFKASAFDTLPVSQSTWDSLPPELKVDNGSLALSFQAAQTAGNDGKYSDNVPRYFSCQTCHLRPTTGVGCNKRGAPTRSDLPKHDMTGGNSWMAPLIKYLDSKNRLRLGGGLTQLQIDAIDAGRQRAADHLTQAASLTVNGDKVKITNLTGHKLLSGYPEGRRMWLNIKWYDTNNQLVREDGKYGPLGVFVDNPATGQLTEVESIIDLEDSYTRIYDAHYAITSDWAAKLMEADADYYGPIPVSYDRATGAVELTINDLAQQGDGAYHESFHFVLNNHIAKDNRIPPYGMEFEEARKRNALPVPADQYGGPKGSEPYDHWDEFSLNVPPGAVRATIDLLYQGTSWEYIQFLYLANNGTDPARNGNLFLGEEGENILDAWLNAGPAQNPPEPAMVPPQLMASTVWPVCSPAGSTETSCVDGQDNDCDGLIDDLDSDCKVCTKTESIEISCADGVDNDCDGFVDSADEDCQVAIDCTTIIDQTTCTNEPTCRWNRKSKTCLKR